MKITVTEDVFPLARAFTISRGSKTEARVITATIEDGGFTGRGEGLPYPRYNETVQSAAELINGLPSCVTRESLQDLLPGGAARAAVDGAFWDLEAKRSGKRVWQLAGLPDPKPVTTAYTLSLEDPATMREQAAQNAWRPLLKIKLGGEGGIARLEAVREGAPRPRIIIDANEGWTAESYSEMAPALIRLGVEMVEQPLPAGDDDALGDLDRVLPVCADESCHDRASLADLRGKYDMINIKLDKTGGLTEALALRAAAEADGFKVMVGCMVESSLSIAPAVLVAQGVDVVDLDAPLLLGADRRHALKFDDAGLHPSTPELWG
ncbi:N-acetyl-D-Glu racemase DgcA [Amaricoccus tamworthensis]|uniref:N-acetyl-D-Glu racemase DgcA n=1 Tax=Amaricoccus tamworthensis TaxID=57002 RepID=UPI003C79743F